MGGAEQHKREADVATNEAQANLELAQGRRKGQAEKRRTEEPNLKEGTEVLLSTKNIQWMRPGARKLLPLWIGPFKVVQKVGRVAYKLDLPPEMRMHNVFHVNLLKCFIAGPGKVDPPLPPEKISWQLEWEAEKILNHDPSRKKDLIRGLAMATRTTPRSQKST